MDTDGSDPQDSFENGLHADRSTNHELSSGWTRSRDASRGKPINNIQHFSAWTRYGDPNRERVADNTRLAPGGSGWWKQQMLVDRSLRTMAGLTTIFALILLVLSIRYLPDLVARKSMNSTSVGSQSGQDCRSLETTNSVRYECWLSIVRC